MTCFPIPDSWFGQTGWFRVPLSWFTTVDKNGNVWASPNNTFNNPAYLCRTSEQGHLVFTTLGNPCQTGFGDIPEAINPVEKWYYGTFSGDIFDQGFDPALGPPFPPIDYQLFVGPHFDASNKLDGAILSWTVPQLTFAYSLLVAGHSGYDLWLSDTSDAASAVLIPPLPGGQIPQWMPAKKYIWATTPSVAPVNPGFSMNSGNTFSGIIAGHTGLDPGTWTGLIPFGFAPGDITGFDVYRQATPFTTSAGTPEGTNIGSPLAADLTFTDLNVGTPALYYRLIGHTSDVILPDFIYNDVALTKAFPMSISRTAGVTQISWQTPTLT